MADPGNGYDDDRDDLVDDDRERDEPFDSFLGRREGCVLGANCIAADPFHSSDECWTAEMAEAYFAESDDLTVGSRCR